VANGRCGEGLAKDLERLRALKAIDISIAALENLGPATSGLWTGQATNEQLLEAALTFNDPADPAGSAGSAAATGQVAGSPTPAAATRAR
jgi:hypothetical protein